MTLAIILGGLALTSLLFCCAALRLGVLCDERDLEIMKGDQPHV